jgi:D-3-phosphoglycerate dehydrogenase / 2-oxoglutarate reductase
MWKILSCSRLFGKIVKEPALFLRKKGFIFLENPFQGKTLTEEQIISLGAKSNVLIVGTEKISRKVIESLKDLKIVTVHGVGVENIDLEAATERKVLITNAPGANTEAVADLTFMLMLGVARKVINAHQMVTKNNWGNVVGYELYGKTLGLIGFGNIGKAVARRAKGFDMKILVYDPYIKPEQAESFSATLSSLEDIFNEADFVSLHAELNKKTCKLIGMEQLSLMKPSAIFVNAARGGLIDTKALISCLEKKQIVGAGLDVFDPEPPDGEIFGNLDNVLLSPHMGGFTFEALERVGNIVAKNIFEAYNGNTPPNLVNK